MTEISSGANFTASSRLLQEMHKRAKDGTIDAADVTELNRVATDDTSGMTDDEKAMIASLHSGEGGTTAELAARNVAALNSLPGKTPATPAVDQTATPPTDTVADVQTITEHQTAANEVDFSQLKLVTSEKSTLSRLSFGLFGGSNQIEHSLNISDGSTPVMNNPTSSSTMSDRSVIERQNFERALGPLESELQLNSPDLRQRMAEIVAKENGNTPVAPDDPRVQEKIDGLRNSIQQFKSDPQKGPWTSNPTLTALMKSYADRPAGPENTRMTSGYLATIQGSFITHSDSNRMGDTEQKNIQAGNISMPATTAEINGQIETSTAESRTALNQLVTDSKSFTAQLKALRESTKPEDKAAYAELINGMDESAIDLLQAQTSDLEAHLKSGQPITQAQMSQANMILGTTMRLKESLRFPNATARTDLQAQLDASKATLQDPNTADAQRSSITADIQRLEAEMAALPEVNPETVKSLESLKSGLSQLDTSSLNAYSTTESAAATRSSMLAELNHAKTNLQNILSTTNVSGEVRTKLSSQLAATEQAISQLSQNQPLNLPPAEDAALQDVLKGLQQLKPPAPPARPTPTSPALLTPTTPLLNLDNPLNVGMPRLVAPTGLNFSSNLPATTASIGDLNLSLNSPTTFGYGFCTPSSSNWFDLDLDFDLGGLNTGYFGPFAPSDSTAPDAAATPERQRQSFNDILLQNAGADPRTVGQSTERQERQTNALAVANGVNPTTFATQEHVNDLKAILQNPNHPKFDLAATTFESYKQLIDKGVKPESAEAIFLLADAASFDKSSELNNYISTIREIPNAGNVQEIEQRLTDLKKGTASTAAQNRENRFNTLSNSELVKNILGDLDTAATPGGEPAPATGSTTGGVSAPTTGSTPPNSELLRLIQHPDQQAVNASLRKIESGIQENSQSVLAFAGTVPELQGRNITTLAQLDAALAGLAPTAAGATRAESDELKQLRTDFQALKNDQKELHTLKLMRTDYQTRMQSITGIADDPNQPEDIRNMFRGFATELQTKGYLSDESQEALQITRVTTQSTNVAAAAAGVQATNQPRWDRDWARFSQIPDDAMKSDGTVNEALFEPLLAHRDQVISNLEQNAYGTVRGRHLGDVIRVLGAPPTRTDGTAVDGSRPGDRDLLITALRNWDPIKEFRENHEANARAQNIHNGGDGSVSTNGSTAPPGSDSNTGNTNTESDAAVTSLLGRPMQRLIADNPHMTVIAHDVSRRNEDVQQIYTQDVKARQNDVDKYLANNESLITGYNALADHSSKFNHAMEILDEGGPGIFTLDPNTGYPTADTPQPTRGSGAPELDTKTQNAINEANRLEAELDLAPLPSVSSNDIFDEFLSSVVNSVRGNNRDILKLIAAQLARQMVEQVIQNFYKHKREEAAKHHEDALDAMSATRNQAVQQIQQNVTVHNAGNSQAIAAVSGQAEAAAVGEAYGRQVTAQSSRLPSADNIHQEVRSMLQAARTGNPPMTISPAMEEQLMGGLSRIMSAVETPGVEDDLAALDQFQNQLLQMQ